MKGKGRGRGRREECREKRKKKNGNPPTQPIRRTDQRFQLPNNLPFIPTRKRAHNTGHRPRISGTIVRPAYRINDTTAHEIRVAVAEQERAGGLVHGVVLGEVADKGCGEERGDVGVVHYVRCSVAVDFVGVDVAVGGVGDDAVLCD